jgi:hypothetical protein
MSKPVFGQPPPFEVIDGREIDESWQDVTEYELYRKIGFVRAYQSDCAGIVQTPEGSMGFAAGDYIVTDDPPTHAWPVRREVFERTHQLVEDAE